MKLLLHTCCAPCSVYCIDELKSENIEPTVYWFNPNIHPYMEYKERRDCLKEYTKSINVEAIFEENYGLREFCKNVITDLEPVASPVNPLVKLNVFSLILFDKRQLWVMIPFANVKYGSLWSSISKQ